VPPAELAEIARTVAERGGALVVDEIYQGLTYDADVQTALGLSPDVFVVNSFSKYYGMTGWRVGWLVAPDAYVPALERLAQNLYISTSAPAQYAALAAFEPEVRAELERRRLLFRERRDFLVPALRELGFGVPVSPQGAFYVYADCRRFSDDSEGFAREILMATGVAVTPGIDFGEHEAKRHVRFSYANTLENLEEAVRRLKAYLGAG
jgi:aspartate/methionine/tyrosine aminotransferase